MKENYVSGFFENSGENVVNYFLSLQENPLKLIPVILDIAIVIYVIVKIIKFAKDSRGMQLIKGILFFIIAFIFIIVILIKTLMFGDPVSGWPSLACIILFCSGIQLFCLGIMGEYLSKTYLESKKRPIYIIKETEENIEK